jgi:hypothetical protein
MRAREFTEGIVDKSIAALAKKISPQQLELPFATAPKAAITPKQIEYWGYLPGETPQSRQMWTKRFNSEQEAQAWINQRNATPLGSKEIQEGLISSIAKIMRPAEKQAAKELPRVDPTMGKPSGATPTPTRDPDQTPRPTPVYTTPRPTAVGQLSPFRGLISAAESAGIKLVPLGTDKIVQIAGRPIVVVDVGSRTVPFYVSTGGGGKAGVPTGKWYPFFGLGKNGFFNKGWEEAQINSYYGNQALAHAARTLDDTFGNVLPHVGRMESGQGALGKINAGFKPVSYNDSAPFTKQEFEAYQKYINSIVDSI